MHRVYNFSPGPAMLPEDVLLQAQQEMLDWQGKGVSVMEISHRGADFQPIVEQTEADLRELLQIPANYHVLFVAGGASTQFAMVPLNLFREDAKKTADYVDTGIWSKKAIDEAKRFGDIRVVTKTAVTNEKLTIPAFENWEVNPQAAYLHYTPNETIEGVEFHWVPETGDVPLVADMTSCILSDQIDVSRFGVIYAGAQKNLGQAGLTLVIVHDDLLGTPLARTPTLWNYDVIAKNKSLYNTPPTYAWYIMGLVVAWVKKQGGVKVFAERAKRRSEKLYNFIDANHDFYSNSVHPDCRSRMNVPFNLTNEALTSLFLEDAARAGLVNLKGHRLAGGIRASMYNAMPEAGVDALVSFMQDFANKKG